MMVWRDVPNYEGLYQVNNYGDVKTLSKRKGFTIQNEQCIKLKINRTGYLIARLFKDGKRKDCFAHRLVALAFLAVIEGKNFINHKDGNKLNNSVENLEWCTISENIQHAFDTGLKQPATAKGTASPKAKLTDDNVRFIRTSGLSFRKLAEQFNVHHSIIDGIKKRKRWAHVL